VTADDLRARLADLSTWRRAGERAPHKPLLLLWALGRLVRGHERLASFVTVDAELRPLRPLLEEFGPPRRTYHTRYPFWYLRNDGLWQVTGAGAIPVREGASEPSRTALLEAGTSGGLSRDAFQLLKEDPRLLREAAVMLLDAHFPASSHDDLLMAVGLDLLETVRRRRRDPAFREAVLVAYGYRCAVCGFDARLRHAPVGIEAAHIRWHQAAGPDVVPNGLALCSLHHKLFDRGALTNGGEAARRWLVDLHGRAIAAPRDSHDTPAEEHLAWHRREVYRAGPPRPDEG
jgi:putative restriction endonuclease